MSLTGWLHSHARSLVFLLVVLIVAGIFGGLALPVALFPQVSFPRVRISLDAGDRPAERMAVEVTYKVEQAVRAIPGVRGVRSTTSRGSAEISVNFDWGEDMISAMLQVESEVNKILSSLPPGTTFDVQRMDPTVFPVIAYSITSSTHSLSELHDLAMYQLRPVLSTVPGVAQVGVQGGAIEEYRVVVDPGKLQSFKMTLADVAKALSASNVLVAVGRIEDHDKLYLIVSDTRMRNVAGIGQTVLRSGNNGVVRLEDVALVEPSTEPQWIRVTANGRDAVLFQVYQQPGSNTVQIAQGIKQKLQEEEKRLPKDLQISNWYDQSELIIASEHSTRDAVLIGIVLAAIVLLIFLRNWKVTLIAIMAVPASLAATMLLLDVAHMSLNIMTLGGMAAAVGLIIDDAIVMVEHIMRRLGHGTGSEAERVQRASDEFTGPLVGSSAATIIIFLPLAFLSGVTGAFFKALSLTMACALFVSFLIAWVALPILCARVLGKDDAEPDEPPPFMQRINRGYEWIMQRALRRGWLFLTLVTIPLLVLGWFAFRQVASGFMPTMDEGGFILDYKTEPGTSLAETDHLLREVEAVLSQTPEVQSYSRRTGLQLGGGITEANSGDFFVRLKPPPRRGIETVMDDVRTHIEQHIPGLQIETAQLMEDLIGDLTSVPQPIEIKLYSDNEKLLKQTASKVQRAIEKVSGVVEVKNGVVLAGDALNIEVDRVKAALEGMDPDSITTTLDNYLSGSVTTYIQRGPKLIGVRVWLPQSSRQTLLEVGELLLHAPDGHLFPLKRVAKIVPVIGQPEIQRDNLKRMVAVTGRISGRDLGSTVQEIRNKVLDQKGFLPASVPYTLGGLYEQQQIAFKGLTIVLIAAILLVFTLLLFLYESFRVAIAMLAMPLLAVAAVYTGLWLTGTEFNITSRMGMTMIVGIVTEVAIFYYSEFKDLAGDGDRRKRFIAAGVNRMRPIAMTSFAAILALLPLALGIGQGSAMQQPLAIAIISGLVAQLPLVLIVLPVLLFSFGVGRQASSEAAQS
ncbi:MAG: efflux RND transporter permease subunit [Chthoniobacterales bacterium]